MRAIVPILMPMLLAATTACSTMPHESTATFVARSQRDALGLHRYQVFVPARADRDAMPVILFLHGSGERGDDGDKQTAVGLGPHVRARADDFPALVVFPQAPADSEWTGAVADRAFAALDAALREFGGDPARVYLTGLSRGGYGTWELALSQPDRFAALVPVCGGITAPPQRPDLAVDAVLDGADPFAEAATRLRHVPTWIFHGARDDLVPPEQSRRMAAALREAGADVRYTEIPDANHNAWDPAYAHAPLWDWLFAQRRE